MLVAVCSFSTFAAGSDVGQEILKGGWGGELDLLRSFLGFVAKMDDILPSISEKLLAKALEVPVYQSQHSCNESSHHCRPTLGY